MRRARGRDGGDDHGYRKRRVEPPLERMHSSAFILDDLLQHSAFSIQNFFLCSQTLSKSGAGAPRTLAMTTWRDCSKARPTARVMRSSDGRASLCRKKPPGASIDDTLVIASVSSSSSK